MQVNNYNILVYWRIAQLVARRAVNSNVAGSSPAPSAKIVNI